jgi:hypothetical protein
LEMNPQAANARKALMARLYQEEDKAKPASLIQTMQQKAVSLKKNGEKKNSIYQARIDGEKREGKNDRRSIRSRRK